MNFDNYTHFTFEDFCEDENFQKWAFQPDLKSENFWRTFLDTHPEQAKNVEEAKKMILSIQNNFHFKTKEISDHKAKESLDNLMQKIDQVSIPKKNNVLFRWITAAAILFLVGSISFYFTQKEDTLLHVYSTGNGERILIKLPDSSQVQLNANSKLSYYPDKWNANNREVILDGEAYFDVQRKSQGTKFTVHAGAINVAVLGTAFNVHSRGEKSEVVLVEGKIELDVATQKIAMTPGDYVSYSKKSHKVESKKVNTSDYAAWKDGITVFNNSLEEVVKKLEAVYGVPFIIENETLQNRQIQLSAPADSLNHVLEILKLVHPQEIKVKEENGQIIIF